jgi:DNA-binding NtrC family response regulator/tetratricopeptide (TPR) repeat protein
VALDRRAREPESAGFVVVHGAVASLSAMAAHLGRRARAAGRTAHVVLGAGLDDAWRELGVRLGLPPGHDPLHHARGIVERAAGCALVVVEGAATKWGRAVADEVARLAADAPRLLVVALRASEPGPLPFGDRDGAAVVTLEASLSRVDRALWWDAVASEAAAERASLDRIESLEDLWSVARTLRDDAAPARPRLGEAASGLLARLGLSQRSLAPADAARLGPAEALDELLACGAVVLDDAGRLERRFAASSADPAVDAAIVASALVADTTDPWAQARAAELFALAGQPERAEAAIVAALETVPSADARADFWQRWAGALDALEGAGATPRLLRSAELALRLGDVDRALELARAAAARGGDSYEVMLTLGRATTARGDLTTAAIALAKALERAPSRELGARAAAEMAELCYTAGRLDDARRHADDALARAGSLATRLSARNVLGKLLLATSSWSEAEQHFAADACDATCGGDLVAELRARLNRAIALLSSGRRDEAWDMLASVLADGERRGEERATAFALANLATIATVRHEYRAALDLWARSIDALRRLGDKLRLSRLITNLAELRLKLGLVAEAEQALAFGRMACGPGMPAARFAHFSVVAARIHLARGRTIEAATEIAAAIGSASSSSHGSTLGDCHLVAARIALDDGDLSRARRALGKAKDEVTEAPSRAELALLRATLARAAGDEFASLAEEALELAREAEDHELTRETHVLLHHAAVLGGDDLRARAHLAAAASLRDKVAGALPDELRGPFLARRDLAPLAKLESEVGAPAAPAVCLRCGSPGCAGCARPRLAVAVRPAEAARGVAAPARRIVGVTPAIQALRGAIHKVGRTDATVLVQGESGTGKELVAEAIHEASARRGAPLVKVNCAALVETLLLSELFGHEKGSFTGAAARRRGRFELADGGTLFLDEIGDISPKTQVALLRVLQDHTFERVGGASPIKVDVRVVCATHRDLRAMVARGDFREDLYYRLRGVVLEVPALRRRLADLPALAEAILERVADERRAPALHLSDRAAQALARHTWPGNVRELENALRAAAVFAESEVIELEDLTHNVEGLRDLDELVEGPVTLRAAATAEAPRRTPTTPPGDEPAGSVTDVAYASVRAGVSLFDMKRQIEHDCIARALAETGGNITRAAALLGMKRPRLSQLVKQYELGVDAEES